MNAGHSRNETEKTWIKLHGVRSREDDRTPIVDITLNHNNGTTTLEVLLVFSKISPNDPKWFLERIDFGAPGSMEDIGDIMKKVGDWTTRAGKVIDNMTQEMFDDITAFQKLI